MAAALTRLGELRLGKEPGASVSPTVRVTLKPASAETPLAGFAQFGFTAQNADPTVVTEAVAAAGAGVRAKGSAPT